MIYGDLVSKISTIKEKLITESFFIKGQQHKNVLDYEKRRHLLLSLAHRQNASNLRRFSDALSLISKVFGEYVVMCRYLESRIPSTQH